MGWGLSGLPSQHPQSGAQGFDPAPAPVDRRNGFLLCFPKPPWSASLDGDG